MVITAIEDVVRVLMGRRQWVPARNINVGIRSDATPPVGELLAALGRACIAVGLPGLAKKAARPAVLRSFALVMHDVLASRMSNLFTPADRFDPGARAAQWRE